MTIPALSASRGNLPTSLSVFIGREREIAEVQRSLSEHRLVTLTGTGGSGKTRLSLKVANEISGMFRDGIWFIEFASSDDPLLVPQAVASMLGIREGQKRSLVDQIINHIRSHYILLVFDNCEHLIGACAELVEQLLQTCVHLRILATSREPLGIPGEAIWSVPPLSLPDLQPWRDLSSRQSALPIYQESEAVQLFVNRARLVSPEFSLTIENGPWVAEICRRLDGLPLAIELAATRVRSLSIQQIAERLDDRFNLLTGGSRTSPPRQQTLAATLDWSYALLSEKECKVLQRLSVFSGGATLDASESVCAGEGVETGEILDLLSQLVDRSLTVAIQGSGETRYSLLETIRQYAREKLVETGGAEQTKDRHLNYFVGWAENAESHLTGPEQVLWLDRYDAESDNLRAALHWSQSDRKSIEMGLRLVVACAPYWIYRGHMSEGRAQLSAALARMDATDRTAARAKVLMQAASLAFVQSDYPAMQPLAEEALSIWRELGESGKRGLAFTLGRLGDMAAETGNYDQALTYLHEALDIYRELNDVHSTSFILLLSGWTLMRTGDLRQAQVYLEEALSLSQASNDQRNLAFSFSSLGEVAIRRGLYERAESLLQQGLTLSREVGERWLTGTLLGSLGWAALRQRDFPRMKTILKESLEIRLDTGDKGGMAWCLEKLAEAAYLEKQYKKATKILGAAAALRIPLGSVIDQADQPEYDRILSSLRAALGKAAFASLWAEGAAMPVEEVIDSALSEQGSKSTRVDKEKFGGLTAREREVVVLIAQGKSNREIAKTMTVGVKTVETYVTRILNKLGFDSRVQIATWAVEKNLQ
ncbi:MAG TPA: tetratricopeptide repeat protein [Anaerolineales bacterium]|nr:tetratricopeptide repeat protein [Anaerolineales bacterium]